MANFLDWYRIGTEHDMLFDNLDFNRTELRTSLECESAQLLSGFTCTVFNVVLTRSHCLNYDLAYRAKPIPIPYRETTARPDYYYHQASKEMETKGQMP